MKKEDLVHLRTQLNKALSALASSNFCEDIECTDCIFNMKGDCKTQSADDEIKEFLNLIHDEINRVKQIKTCDKCGHELEGED